MTRCGRVFFIVGIIKKIMPRCARTNELSSSEIKKTKHFMTCYVRVSN